MLDKADFEGSDASRSLSPSPDRPPRRSRGAPGAGLGPVRFGAGLDSSRASRASSPERPGPLDHEMESSGGRRVLGEPPAQHNPRARVPFREGKKRHPGERGARKEAALARAHGRGWVPTLAPEWNNPNGTGKIKPLPKPTAAKPGAPTVPFEEEFEQFRMQKLRERAARRGEKIPEGGYGVPSSDADEDAPGLDRVGPDYEEQEDESEGELLSGEEYADPNARDETPAERALREEIRDLRSDLGARARENDRLRDALDRFGGGSGTGTGSGSGLDRDGRADPLAGAETQRRLMERQEQIRLQFGSKTSPDPPRRVDASPSSASSASSADAARVSPAPFDPRDATGARVETSPSPSSFAFAFDDAETIDAAARAARAAADMASDRTPLPPSELARMARAFGDGDGDGDGDEDLRPESSSAMPRPTPKRAVPGAPPASIFPPSRASAPLRPASGLASAGAPGHRRAAPPADPPPGRNPSLWPTPFGEPANQIPNRAKRPEIGANYPAPPPEERGLPRYGEMRATQRAGLALTAFTRSVGTGTVGPVGFTGEANSSFLRRGANAPGAYPPDPRAMAPGGADRAAVGLELPPGFSAAEKIESLAASLRGAGRYEGGDAWAGPRMLERDGPAEDRFQARVAAARRGVDGNVAAAFANDGRNPPGGEFVTLAGSGGTGAGGAGAGAGEPPVDRAPVTSASQTMSLNAYRAEA